MVTVGASARLGSGSSLGLTARLIARGALTQNLAPATVERIHRGGRQRTAESEGTLKSVRGFHLVVLDQRHDVPTGAGTSGTSGPMQVGLVVLRRIEVHNTLDAVDVYPAGRDIGGHEHLDLGALEVSQCAVSLPLRPAPVNRLGGDSCPLQLSGNPIGAPPGPGEDERRLMAMSDFSNEFDPLRVLNAPKVMTGIARIKGVAPDLVANRVSLITPGQLRHVTVQRRREKHRLPCLGRHVEQLAHLRHEPHVRHPIGLVDHHIGRRIERQVALINQIEKSAGARDQDVDTASQFAALRVIRHPSVHSEQPQPPACRDRS